MSSSIEIKHQEPHSIPWNYLRWRNPHKDSFKLGYYDLTRLLYQQDAAIQTLKKLRSDATQAIVDGAIDNAIAVDNFLVDCLETFPITERPTASSSIKAEQVFHTPELMESILCKLEPDDIFRCNQVNKAMNAALTASHKLQRLMFLRADPNAQWTSPFLGYDSSRSAFPLFTCRSIEEHDYRYGQDGHASDIEDDEVRVQAEFDHSRYFHRLLPKIGPLGRRMLICQPAPTSMTIHLSCCNFPHSSWKPYDREVGPSQGAAIVKRDTGLTVGDLLDATKKMEARHKDCPNIEAWRLELAAKERAALVSVKFRGHLKLRSNDKQLEYSRYSPGTSPGCGWEDPPEVRAKQQRRQEKMDAFIAARQEGKYYSIAPPRCGTRSV